MRRDLARRFRQSSATINAAITVSRVSPISPNFLRNPSMRAIDVLRPACLQMIFLPVLAGEAELAAGDGGFTGPCHVRLEFIRSRPAPIGSWRWPHPAAGDLAVGAFQPARTRGFAVERRGEPGAVNAERMELVAASPSSPRSASRRRSTAASSASSASASRFTAYRLRFGPSSPASALKNASGGKCLGGELYVLRDPAVNAGAPLCPDVFARLCMARTASAPSH